MAVVTSASYSTTSVLLGSASSLKQGTDATLQGLLPPHRKAGRKSILTPGVVIAEEPEDCVWSHGWGRGVIDGRGVTARGRGVRDRGVVSC